MRNRVRGAAAALAPWMALMVIVAETAKRWH